MSDQKNEYQQIHVPTTPVIVTWMHKFGAKVEDDYRVFLPEDHEDHLTEVRNFYLQLVELDTTYSANLTLVIESTDYVY